MSGKDEIQPLTWKDISRFGVDKKGRMCLDGKPVAIVEISKKEKIIAFAAAWIGALSALAVAIRAWL